ncbi:MAG: DUF3240 family protein [Methylotenera sp.]|nr:DUF3240 family protein [Methylotenera sp.]
MTQDNTTQAMLILIVPPKLEEPLVDILLQQTTISGFTTSPVSGHGTSHGAGTVQLNLIEQVTGRQKRVQIMTHGAVEDLRVLAKQLKTKFANTDIHYILMPLLAL